jgi:hypothetical protein
MPRPRSIVHSHGYYIDRALDVVMDYAGRIEGAFRRNEALGLFPREILAFRDYAFQFSPHGPGPTYGTRGL